MFCFWSFGQTDHILREKYEQFYLHLFDCMKYESDLSEVIHTCFSPVRVFCLSGSYSGGEDGLAQRASKNSDQPAKAAKGCVGNLTIYRKKNN